MNERNWIRELAEAVLIGLAIFLFIQFVIVNYRVQGSSMRPTLLAGEYLMVNKLLYYQIDTDRLGRIVPLWEPAQPEAVYLIRPPERGDVVVFNYPNNTQRQFVKRIIGEPGDRVAIANGRVIINDSQINEPYLDTPGRTTMHPVTLGPDDYFVLGDNRNGSQDSRHWGALPADHIIGKVWMVYWPQSAWDFPE